MEDENIFDEIMEKWSELSREIDILPTKNCLSTIQIIGYVEGFLGDEEKQEVQEHLARCNYCVSEVGKAFRAKEQYEKMRASEINEIKWWELSKSKLKDLVTEAIDKVNAASSQLLTQPSLQAVAADGTKELKVMIFNETGSKEEVAFTVESGPKVDEEGQLVLTLLAPDESYDGHKINIALKVDQNRRLFLASPPVFGRKAFILLNMGLEPGLEIPLERIVATIDKRD